MSGDRSANAGAATPAASPQTRSGTVGARPDGHGDGIAAMPGAPVRHVDAAWVLAEPGRAPALANHRLTLAGETITALRPCAEPPAGPRRLVLPTLANAHDHARTFRNATLGSYGLPLETWLPHLGAMPGLDPYLCAATSLARSARQGVTDVMVHYTRVQGGMPYVEEAQAVARAAADVGVRIGFAVAMRDRQGIAYAPDADVLAALPAELRDAVRARLAVRPESPKDQLARVDAVAQACAGSAVTVQYGPAAVQWCSDALLEAIAQASADHDRPVHMHLLETKYQREWADAAMPGGIVRHLDSLGLLSPRLTLAHCAWCRPDELALLAERGVTISVNTSSNLGLRSGIAPVAEMLRQGCRVAMGLDGMAFDEDDDALREMRLGYALHQGTGLDVTMTPAQLWDMAARHGRRAVGGATADVPVTLNPGARADCLVLDWSALDDDALFDDVDPLHLLLARANGRYIDTVVAGGRTLVQGGKVVSVDETALRAELIAQARAALARSPETHAWRAVLPALGQALGQWYGQGRHRGCC